MNVSFNLRQYSTRYFPREPSRAQWGTRMLKLVTFAIWIGPALILLGYLLLVSRKSLPSSGTDAAKEVEIEEPAAENIQSGRDKQVGKSARR